MAQSDYELAAHISGLNQRTEINSIFDSILTHNSGSTAPAVTKAFMMWVDTSNATYYYLKMRNHDNTAWVTLFIYTISTKVITPFIINSPTANAISKINADSTIGNSNIINDANGNTGFGLTPSTFSQGKSNEFGFAGNSIWGNTNSDFEMLQNAYYNGGYKYANSGILATKYAQINGVHSWGVAPSGTASNAITWTNAMSLIAPNPGQTNINYTSLILDTDSNGTGTTGGGNVTIKKAGNTVGFFGTSGYMDSTAGSDLGIQAYTGKGMRFYVNNSGSTAMSLDVSGSYFCPRMYIDTTAAASNMSVNSSGQVMRSTSSKKYKTNIETIDNSYVDKFFNNARPIYYKSLSENDNPNWGYWGFIAEEVAEFDKRLVHWRFDTKEIEVEKERVLEDETIENYIEKEIVNDESKPMIAEGVMYERITVLLTSKVQEQQKIIDSLISRIEVLESK